MRCSACEAENPAEAKFCNTCGAAQATPCARCGRRNPPTAQFCSECGAPLVAAALEPRFASPRSYTPPHLAHRILAGRGAVQGERKQVTALFCDLVNSTALAEQLGPEGIHALLSQFFELALAEVHRYEGTINKFLGDGFLALFGVPLAHEDHARRGALAALGIRRRLEERAAQPGEPRGAELAVRMGLNTGPVVVGSIGDNLEMDYTAIGDTTNVAARLQQLAEPGTILIGEATARLATGYVRVEAVGPVDLKGKSGPVTAYRLVGPGPRRSRVDVHAERGLSPFVGRERELQTLLARFAEARAGRGQMVFLAGDPGIGKSRLLYELRRRLGGENLTWLEGRCISYGRDTPYLAVIDALKASFGIEEADGEAEIVRNVEEGVRSMGGEVAVGLPYLKSLLAVDPGDPGVRTMDPQMRKALTFEALRALAVAGSAVRPLVLVLEDLHWIDRLSEEFISYLADTVPDHPILIVLTHRPGYEHPFGDRPYHAHLRLTSLSEQESAALAEGMLAVESLPAELQRIIAGKAEGNPFFVEEVIKSLLEVGAIRRVDSRYALAEPVEDIDVPDTVQGVIMARLDRLDKEPKRAIQTAAVIGREFTVRLLDRTAELHGRLEDYLRELKAIELIYERSLYPELAYMFKHAVTQDVAYASLLLAQRKTLHRLVGEAIEGLYADHLAEHYETLAHHYERAEAWDVALDYLQKSGEKALAAFAPQQAVAFHDRALAVLERSGHALPSERVIALHFGRGQALFLTGDWDTSAASFQALLAAAQAAGDRIQEGVALYRLCFAYTWNHRFEDALDYAKRAHRLAVITGDQEVLAGSLFTTAWVQAVTGDLEGARPAVAEALRIARQAHVPLLHGLALHLTGILDYWQGDHARALERLDAAIQIGRRHQLPALLMRSLTFGGISQCGRGDYEQALRYLRENLEVSTRLGDKYIRCKALNSLGWVYMELCNWDLALQHNAQSVADSRALRDPEIIRNAELNLADCYLALGRLDEARRLLETVQRESQQQGTWGETWMKWRYTQHLHASLGELWLARGDAHKALAFADACLDAAVATNSRRYIVKGRRLKGEALLAPGRLGEAEAELKEALRVAREVGNPAQLWKTLAALGRLDQARGRSQDAATAYQEAVTTVERVAAGLSDSALRETFLTSPQVARLREAVLLR